MLNDNIQKEAVATVMDAAHKASDVWFDKTRMVDLVNKLSTNPEDREVITKLVKHCFAEGVFQGSVQAVNGIMNASQRPKL